MCQCNPNLRCFWCENCKDEVMGKYVKYNLKSFIDNDFYDTDDLEKMSKDKLINITEQLQRQLSEAQMIINRIKSDVLRYKEVDKY